MPVLLLIKSMIKGALACGVAGIFVGGAAAGFIWPGSNLGPPVGMVYGVIAGAVVGAILGFGFGVRRVLSSKPHSSSDSSKGDGKTS
jgi:hypothetical protein